MRQGIGCGTIKVFTKHQPFTNEVHMLIIRSPERFVKLFSQKGNGWALTLKQERSYESAKENGVFIFVSRQYKKTPEFPKLLTLLRQMRQAGLTPCFQILG